MLDEIREFFTKFDLFMRFCEDYNSQCNRCLRCNHSLHLCNDANIRDVRPQITEDRLKTLTEYYVENIDANAVFDNSVVSVLSAYCKVKDINVIKKDIQRIFNYA